MSNGRLSYRSDIDGLRAIAVLAVIANHLPQDFLTSGFLGVDVFFVISGFVVSATLLNRGQATFTSFYSNFLSRRIKRLMPALIVCVAITGTVVLLKDPFPKISIMTGIAALFGVANFALIHFELDYFSPSSKFNAFTHMWSLGVEEQFYLVFPWLVWLTVFSRTRRNSAIFPASIAVLSLASFVFFLRLYHTHPVAAYYLMPTRFWELGTGVLALQITKKFTSIWFKRVVAFVAPFALLVLILCFSAPLEKAHISTPMAVCLTALLLLNSSRNITSWMLSLRPVVYVGKISYSLYLWHWPVIALAPLVLKPSWRFSAFYIVAMGLAAIISYHRIERPLREANWSSSKAMDIALGFAGSIVIGASVYFALRIMTPAIAQATAEHYPAERLPLLYSGLPPETCILNDAKPMPPQTFELCTIAPEPGLGMPMIWAMGDSHTSHLQGMLYELHQSRGFGVHYVASPGHLFPHGASESENYPPRQELFQKVLESLKPGDIILISRFYFTRTNPPRAHQDIPLWIDNVSLLAKELENRDVTLVLTGPPPMFNFKDLRECDLNEREHCAVPRATIAALIDPVMKQLNALQVENKHLRVFDMFTPICPPTQEYCYPDDGNRYTYRDQDHINTLQSKQLAEPFANFLQTSGIAPALHVTDPPPTPAL